MVLDSLVMNLFLAILVVAATYDVVLLRIPNYLCVALVALFVAAALPLQNVPWISHVVAGALVFFAGAVLFYFRIFGGGDIKLLAASALWTGVAPLPFLLAAVALLGGVVALAFWLVRKLLFHAIVAFAGNRTVKLPTILVDGEPVPYGLAIVAGVVVTVVQTPLWQGSVHPVFLKYFHG